MSETTVSAINILNHEIKINEHNRHQQQARLFRMTKSNFDMILMH